jgi:hypothetical protein
VAVSCALSGASRGGMSTRTRHSGSWLSPLQYVEARSAAERIPAGAGDPGHQRVVIREGVDVDSQLSRAHGMQIQGDGLRYVPVFKLCGSIIGMSYSPNLYTKKLKGEVVGN